MNTQQLTAFIAESKAICERATPGPWHVVEYANHHALQNTPEYAGIDVLDELGDGPNEPERNYDFCAHARSALPAALAELEALSKMREAAEAWRKHIAEIVGERGDELDISLRSHRERVVALLDSTLVGRGPGK